MALDPADVTPGMVTFGTWTRTHPRTGEQQTRVAETAGEAVQMKWRGWLPVDASAEAGPVRAVADRERDEAPRLSTVSAAGNKPTTRRRQTPGTAESPPAE